MMMKGGEKYAEGVRKITKRRPDEYFGAEGAKGGSGAALIYRIEPAAAALLPLPSIS
jgi:hypothetical protein